MIDRRTFVGTGLAAFASSNFIHGSSPSRACLMACRVSH